jgi:hypothetical protein
MLQEDLNLVLLCGSKDKRNTPDTVLMIICSQYCPVLTESNQVDNEQGSTSIKSVEIEAGNQYQALISNYTKCLLGGSTRRRGERDFLTLFRMILGGNYTISPPEMEVLWFTRW